MLTCTSGVVKNLGMSKTLRPIAGAHLQCDALPDIVDGLRIIAQELDEAGIKHGTRKLGYGPLLNGVVAWILLLKPGERRTLARKAMECLKEVRGYTKPCREWEVIRDDKTVEEKDVIIRLYSPDRRAQVGLGINSDPVTGDHKQRRRYSKNRVADEADNPVSGK